MYAKEILPANKATWVAGKSHTLHTELSKRLLSPTHSLPQASDHA